MILRKQRTDRISTALERSPVVLLSGPRQCGKTTIAREFVPPDSLNYFDCEDPISLARLQEPMTSLSGLRGTIVIDEVQRKPDLFPVLRVLADRSDVDARFLVLGSASGNLLRQTSESLAGRLEVVSMEGFVIGEVPHEGNQLLWLRGGFPRSFLSKNDADSWEWRKQFAATLIERDLPTWGVRVASSTLMRFWQILAHYHGQTWNASEISSAMGLSQPTVRNYLDIMTDALVVRQLQPFHANVLKRQVKSPKIMIRDSGLLHQLLGIQTERDLMHHPRHGASWEGWIIESILSTVQPDAHWFWATHAGAEIDLVLEVRGRRIGVEVKRTDQPRITPSVTTAQKDLELDDVYIVYAGTKSFVLAPNIHACAKEDVAALILKNCAR